MPPEATNSRCLVNRFCRGSDCGKFFAWWCSFLRSWGVKRGVLARGEDFDEFVRASGPRLLRLAVLLTGDRVAGEDLLQDVYERVFVHWRRIGGVPEAYVRRALVNAAASRWRRRMRRPEVRLSEVHDRPAVGSCGVDGVDLVATRAELMAALQRLAPRQRAVIVLRFYEDLTMEQVAEVLGCSVGTVRSQSHRALSRLRESPEFCALEDR
jgi:RNA polymerase sigma-70 factor (sigma-E family)